MIKVALGKPLSTTVPGKLDWILRALHQIEVASAKRDPALDEVAARLVTIEDRLVAIEARLDALETP